MITRLLIANRGEIACRIIRTARRLGLRTIAVYSAADAHALHVALADEAWPIGPAPARDSYLKIDAVIEAARRSVADAIHPGYGFLSENAGFADACADAGIIFIGPPPNAIRAMGSKSASKDLMARAGVPLVPGYHGADQDPVVLARAAEAIGYPVLIKASAGGGGKGMRVVEAAAGLEEALAAARREAEASFGDPLLLIEKYLLRPRHIEMQVFADRHGNCIHLFERDCSIQRRYQKVVEEAPAPGMTDARRAAFGAAAVAAARAVGYVGAGTVEFIAPGDDGADDFYFMEMNTRLQVEHPVTEAITGLDLVEWQIRVADGETLPLAQDQVTARGHAIEARLYAEDPARDFLPQPGRLDHVAFPADAAGVRVDAGVRSGDAVPREYDPMIAKLIGWGATRAEAIARLGRALADTEIAGVRTNRGFLAAIVGHPAFAAGEIDTGFIARHRADLLPAPAPAGARILALATLARLLAERRDSEAAAAGTADPHSPWAAVDGWRLNREAWQECLWRDGEATVAVRARFGRAGFVLSLPGGLGIAADGALARDGALLASLDGVRSTARVVRRGDAVTVFDRGAEHLLTLVDPLAAASAGEAAAGKLTAPMPGRISAVRVTPGERVARGHALIVVEAMKMEHTITAPAAGVVGAVHYRVGDLVEEGAELLVLEIGEAA